jgi:hypothetical protein
MPSVASVLALLLICAPFTIAAVGAFPIWDDASLWLLIQERGLGALVAGHSDRPVMGHLWSLLAISENTFWVAALVAQALLWPGLGLLSALVWRHYFPSLRRFAWLVGCVAVAPFATKVQMVTVNIALASFLSVALAYTALVLFLRLIAGDDRWSLARFVAGLSLLALAILIQEYALSVVIVMVVLFGATALLSGDGGTQRRAFRVIGASIMTAGVAYLIYFLIADQAARTDVHPSYATKLLAGDYFLTLPFRLISVLWWGTGDGVANSLSDISFVSKPAIFAAAYGLIVALLLVYGCYTHAPAAKESPRPKDVMTALLFGLALIAGVTPMVLMGRIPWDPNDGMSSRFGLPVLPLAAALIVFAMVALVRARLWAVPVLVLGFAAGHATFSEAWSAVRERRMMAAVGEALKPYMSSGSGYTVAVIPLPERSLGPRRQWELTARVAASWPAELRQRFWAYRFGGGLPLYSDEEAGRVFGPRGNCRRPGEIDREVRLVVRRGHLERLLWVEPHSDGSISVEPYCIRERVQSNGTATETGKTQARPFDRRFFG